MKNILVLEDNKIAQKHIESIIQELDIKCTVHLFDNTKDAYQCALEQTIDLFLVDIILDTNKLGDLSGVAFVQNLRRIERYRHAFVIFITCLEDPKLYSYRNLHCYAFIEKPFDAEELKGLIEECLEEKKVSSKSKILAFRKDGILLTVECNKIVYAECRNHIMSIYTTDKDKLVIPYLTLKKLMRETDSPDIVQCRRNAIFNRKHVYNIDCVNKYIIFRGDLGRTEIGITYVKQVLESFQ